jgi:hypothetical protein
LALPLGSISWLASAWAFLQAPSVLVTTCECGRSRRFCRAQFPDGWVASSQLQRFEARAAVLADDDVVVHPDPERARHLDFDVGARRSASSIFP